MERIYMRNDRLLEMEKVIGQSGTISMTELCDLFNVSMNTVRRDVAELRRRGDVEKVYGGVCAVENNGGVLRPFTERQTIADAAKRAICREAAKLLEDGDVVFVDSGTTMVHLVDNLANRQELTIITNNLALVQQAIPYDNLRMIVLPGQLRRKTNSLTGMETVRALRQYNIRKAFLAATGSTLTGVTNSSPQEYEIKRTALECSGERILLLCKQKFGHAGLMTYADFQDFHYIVTDQPLDAPYAEAVKRAGATVLTP
ncbi:MAG TPA: DeoR/GlpR transcriptional regulator [Candidatus Egerieenecus merdigallinarum]|nr:DeoR/GlpR transcriptional regulator [Candidatus Egerieenecus merdigallinarum]